MDQYLSTVIIALITGIFSVITLVIQKKQDKVIDKIDEQTLFIEKEKALKHKLTEKEKEREEIIHEMLLMVLNTNLYIMTHNIDDEVLIKTTNEEANALKERYSKIRSEIDEISKEYEMLLDISDTFSKSQSQHDRNQ